MADASGGRGGRRRAALLPGARSPAEMMARLAAEQAEAGERPGGDADAAATADSGAGQAEVPCSSPDDRTGGLDDGEAPAAAGHSPAAAQPPAATAQQQTPAAPTPAYTSLARQQLHARLKAAITAGTGSPATAAASAAHHPARHPPAQQRQRQARGGPVAAGSSGSGVPWPPPAVGGMSSELLLPALGAPSSSSGSLAGASPLAAEEAPGHLLLPLPAADLDESSGFQLPLPGRSLRQRAASPQPSGLGGTAHSPPSPSQGPGSSAPAPNWLAAELLGQQLYQPLPEGGGAACSSQQQQQQGVQRGLLSLAMPPLTERFFGAGAGAQGASVLAAQAVV